ncbi:hypothetical protein [uncultured Bacteroides sp.]|uniref:hypothetical protein n=1 Tax=uncultured Bacteroides sp. TaxID=162156 RepID=UPI002AA8C998|nr:hypothetical protein [uncultured Bacteroides sp.]
MITDLCVFLKYPNVLQAEEIKNKRMTFGLFFLIHFLFILSCAIVWALMKTFGVKIPVNNVLQEAISKYGLYAYPFIILIAPLFEEILFRLPLLLQKKMLVVSSGISLLYFLPPLFFAIANHTVTSYRVMGILVLFLYFVFALMVNQNYLDYLKRRHYNKIIWGNVLVFTALHFFNYAPFHFYNLMFLLPVFSLAIFVTYLRCKLGFKYNVAFHILNNLMIIL